MTLLALTATIMYVSTGVGAMDLNSMENAEDPQDDQDDDGHEIQSKVC